MSQLFQLKKSKNLFDEHALKLFVIYVCENDRCRLHYLESKINTHNGAIL